MSSIVGIFVNLLLFAGKFIVGTLFTSVAIVADSFNNLSDAGSSIISLVTFRISGKPADRGHPFGHARIEYVASMIVSFIILVIGFQLLVDSFKAVINPSETQADLLAIAVLSGAILFKLWLFLFYRKIAHKIDSTVLKAASVDSLSDVASTGAVLVSTLIIRFTGWTILDGIVGMIVAVMILIAGIRILRENMNSIMGEAPVAEVIDSIKEVVSHYPDALGIHDLMVHNYGPGHIIASLHIEVDGSKNIFELHDTIDNIERQIRDVLHIACTVHMDPIVVNDPLVTELHTKIQNLVREIDPAMNIHDFRYIHGTTHQNLIFDVAVPFEVKKSNDEVKREIEERIKKINPSYCCVLTIDRV
jgi:cation diffusion facilitator family transporter